MLPKGTARPLKAVIGIILALYVITSFYPIEAVTNILDMIPYLQVIVMGLAAFFLIRTGRQLG